MFGSKDEYLNKAHVQYIESRLVGLAQAAKRCELDNSNVPQPPSLSQVDAADAESFLADVLLCLPVVGVTLFEPAKAAGATGLDLRLKAKGIEGRGVETPQGFVVRAGSRAVKKEVTSIPANVTAMRHTLIAKGVLQADGESYRLAQDYTFASPSLAAAVLIGRSANGRTAWKDAKGRTLKAIQDAKAGGG